MAQLREYLIAVVAAGMFGAIGTALVKNGFSARVTRFAAGLLVLLAVCVPLLRLDLSSLFDGAELNVRDFEAEEYAERAQKALREQLQNVLEQQIAAQAELLGAAVSAELTVSTDEIPEPLSVTLTGKLSAEQLNALSSYLTDAIGIPPSRQKWRIDEESGT